MHTEHAVLDVRYAILRGLCNCKILNILVKQKGGEWKYDSMDLHNDKRPSIFF